ncbi:MAG: M3 family oligoendopeptidase [Saprospiraceae bacterium]|nr:M3 family oligoendopeptidase [Saprospiraceae bacterium]
MLKFENYQYTRPDIAGMTAQFDEYLTRFENATSFEEQSLAFDQANNLKEDFYSMRSICQVRHTIDTGDAFYEAENNFFDEQIPHVEALTHRLYQVLIRATFREELEAKWGRQLFRIAELSLKTFSPEIIEDLQEENRISSDYIKLKAGAVIEFQGETYNLSSIQRMETSPDREIRAAACEAKWQFFVANGAEFDHIFDQLVKIRHRIAQKLGYPNFVPLGYARMLRTDYDAAMVQNFRRQIKEFIVPLATQLFERQRIRLGLDVLKHYDDDFRFASGNPKPKGDPEWIVERAASMYAELSSQTDAFFTFMRESNLMDLEAKPGKATGGYCTYINKYQAPFIFSNFNGSSQDIYVLTHEAGHAFQVYSSRNLGISEYHWPTYEACEIHSMSMEYFTWPWMDQFFLEEADKYRFAHITDSICFLPYGVAVDEFQHTVYENPDFTPQQRHQAWRELERSYLPHRNYEDSPHLEAGTFWQKQTHIFAYPFYYIDYTLAQICAFQFWKRNNEDHEKAWADYVRLCETGGSKSFLDLVALAGLRSPFEDGCLASVIDDLKHWLAGVDDAAF